MVDFSGSKVRNDQAALDGNSHRAEMGDDMGLAGITVVIALASLIGLWGLSCLASGLIKSGGIIGLGTSWISAVFGF
ncbi:MAG: hypothetical protein ABFS09_11185 [Thermodesulfobacteriota bacterium]